MSLQDNENENSDQNLIWSCQQSLIMAQNLYHKCDYKKYMAFLHNIYRQLGNFLSAKKDVIGILREAS